MTRNAIEVDKLTRYFGKSRGIEDVSFDVREGEIFGFLGPNGAGKTVTIRQLMGLLSPTRGQARVFGLDCWAESPQVKANVGYLPGDARFYEQMTGDELLDFLSAFREGNQRDRRRELADRLDLDTSRRIKHLSRGNRQKLLIVQALMHDAPLLILDEPSSGLDPLKQVDFLQMLREERDRGKTIFLSSHQLNEVERIADRVAIIRGGELVAVEDVSSLKSLRERTMELSFYAPVSPDRFDSIDGVRVLNRSPDGRVIELSVRGGLEQLLSLLASLPIEEMVYGPAQLESVFLHYYGGEAQLREDEIETAKATS